jgi:FkbH-like protein
MGRIATSAGGLLAADFALARAEWQHDVFARRPRRLALLQLHAPWPLQRLRISVLRNHAVEATMSVLRAFLAYSGYEADVAISGYDDALTNSPSLDADVHLIWVDVSRYASDRDRDVTGWFAQRLRSLRDALRGSILVVGAAHGVPLADRFNAMLAHEADSLPDVFVFPLAQLTETMGPEFSERRSSEMGTQVSGTGATVIAQHLGLQWIPALLRPRLKALIVDLDHTLVGGVLAEDGIAELDASGGYARLRSRLLELHDDGLLLALVSKNDPGDVERLFAERSELREIRSAFVAVEASWRSKAASVALIIDRLGFGTDSALIVDDNAGEIAAMAAALGDPWFVLARDPDLTTRALELHPGLLAPRRDEHARSRGADVVAAERRVSDRRSAPDPRAYVASLHVRMGLRLNPVADRSRLSELTRKTNQFNTSLRRFSEVDVDEYLHSSDRCVVSVRLRDRVSDSGTIAGVFARRQGDSAIIDVIAVSCRALGRGLEGVMLAEALGGIARHLGIERVLVPIIEGPRNHPARSWANATTARVTDGIREIASAGTLAATAGSLPVELHWEADDD